MGKITKLKFANVFFLWENGVWVTGTGNYKQKNGNRTRVWEKTAGKWDSHPPSTTFMYWAILEFELNLITTCALLLGISSRNLCQS